MCNHIISYHLKVFYLLAHTFRRFVRLIIFLLHTFVRTHVRLENVASDCFLICIHFQAIDIRKGIETVSGWKGYRRMEAQNVHGISKNRKCPTHVSIIFHFYLLSAFILLTLFQPLARPQKIIAPLPLLAIVSVCALRKQFANCFKNLPYAKSRSLHESLNGYLSDCRIGFIFLPQ